MSGGFEALGLIPELLKSVADLGWALPTDVQDESIPLILGGGDVMVASETGSGKTAAFCLPILQCVYERLRELGSDAPEQLTGPFEVKISSVARDEAFSVAEDGTGCSMKSGKEWGGARASYGVKSGKYYYEAVVKGSGLCRFGWSTTSAQLELGKDGHGFGYGGTGMKSNDGTFAQYGEKFNDSDTIGCYLDLEKKTISYSKNGKDLGTAFTIPENVIGSVYFPAVSLQDCSSTLNFGGLKPFVTDISGKGYLSLVNAVSDDIVFESSKKAFKVIGKRLPLAIIIEPVNVLAEQVRLFSPQELS
jgi:ATP-dependent RNA helicase DDX1